MKNLVRLSLIVLAFQAIALSVSAQDTCVAWTFPNNPDDAISDAGIPANSGSMLSVGGGVSVIDFSTAGLTTNAANATGWDNGTDTKYWLIHFSSMGFSSLNISSVQRSTNTGPRDFKLQYSLDTTIGWTDVVGGSIVTVNNWVSGVVNNLALPTACTNQNNVFIRWLVTSTTSVSGGTVAAAGASRIDDIYLMGSSAYAPIYASLPYSMGFDNLWIDGNSVQDVPSNNWLNTPETGNNSWRRDDNISVWTSGTGAYTPTGALSTAHSARFHTWDIPNGQTGSLDLYVNCSSPGLKELSFYYINASGNDKLTVLLSTNGGISFSALDSVTTATVWTKHSISLGALDSSTCVIRFRGRSDYGVNDIGLDEVNIGPPPAVDAGIEMIVAPGASTIAGLQPVKVKLMNYGSDSLLSADIHWTVNGIAQTTLPWAGILAPGISADSITLGNYSFTAGTYLIRSWTTNPNGMSDGNFANDTAFKFVTVTAFATLPFSENFDGNWINKYDTLDVPSSFWVNNPSFGNNSWRRDDEGTSGNWQAPTGGAYTPAGAFSTTHSARFHTYYASNGFSGNLDLQINLSPAGSKTLSFYMINTNGTDVLNVLLSTDGGTSFTQIASNNIVTNWTKFIYNLGSVNSPTCIIRFRATSDFGNTDIGLDQVTVSLTGHDAGVLKMLQPMGGCGLGSNEAIEVEVVNPGGMVESNIPVTCNINGSPITETISGPLNPGDTLTYMFTATADLSVPGPYNFTVFTGLSTDSDHSNDTVVNTIAHLTDISSFPFLENFESANVYFDLTDTLNSGIAIQGLIGNNNSHGLRMTGGAQGVWPGGTGTSTTATQAWDQYNDHQANAFTCIVDATSLAFPELLLDLRQTNSSGIKYSWFRVLINDSVQIADENSISDFNPLTNSDPYTNHTFDLSTWAGTSFKLTLQSCCKYDSLIGGQGDNAFVDNIIIREKPQNDIAVTSWIAPLGGSCGMGNDSIVINVFNPGVNDQVDYDVSYSIDGGSNWITETIYDTLFSGDSVQYTFTTPANFSVAGQYNCIATGSLLTDDFMLNDTTFYTLTSVPTITMYPYAESFEGFSGWSSGTDGINDWELGTPGTTQLNAAHSGTKAWVTKLSSNYTNNANCWLTSPCLDFTTLTDPQLYVWLNINCESGWDGMVMETTVNDVTWTQFMGDTIFYNNNDAMGNLIPPKWSGNNGGWVRYKTALTGFAGQSYVRIRFRFNADNSINGEGIALDDILITDPLPYNPAVVEITAPIDGCQLGSAENVTATVYNDGTQSLSNIPIMFSADGGAWVNEVMPGPISSGASASYTFTTTADFSAPGPHELVVAVSYAQDIDLSNDTITINLNKLNTISAVPYLEDFESGNVSLELISQTNAGIYLAPGEGETGSVALQFTGGNAGSWPGGTASSTTPPEAWDTYIDHHAYANTCDISLSGLTALHMSFKLRQTHSGSGPLYSWFRVMANASVLLTDSVGVSDFNPFTEFSDSSYLVVFDLSSYMSSSFFISLQSSNKYNPPNSTNGIGDNAFIDELRFYDPTSNPGFEEQALLVPLYYPNPTNDKVNIYFNKVIENGQLRVYSINGQLIKEIGLSHSSEFQLDVSTYTPGLYCIQIQSESETARFKIIKH